MYKVSRLAIVPHEPHGLSKRPLGSGVGGEAPMVHGKGCGVGLILQVLVKLPQSCRLKHALHCKVQHVHLKLRC